MALSLVESTDAYVVGASGPVLIGSFRLEAQADSVRAFERTCEALRARHARFAMIGTAEDAAKPPGRAVRERIVAMLRAYAGSLVAVSFLIEGDGFRASLLRGITTGLTAMTRGAAAYQVASSGLGASRWVADQLFAHGVRDVPPAELLAVEVQRLRQAPIGARLACVPAPEQ